MPRFLDDFSSSILNNKEAIKEKIFKGTPNPLQSFFKEHFDPVWITIDDPTKLGVNPSELSIMSVDSSNYTDLLSTGGIFYIIRSLADCRGHESKRLESDVFFIKGSAICIILFTV